MQQPLQIIQTTTSSHILYRSHQYATELFSCRKWTHDICVTKAEGQPILDLTIPRVEPKIANHFRQHHETKTGFYEAKTNPVLNEIRTRNFKHTCDQRMDNN